MKNKTTVVILICGYLLCVSFLVLPPIVRGWLYPNYICDNKVVSSISTDLLVGSWVSTKNSNTYYEEIIILDEFTYQQIVVMGNIDYKSPHYSWYVEQNEEIGTYLHFDHMRYCRGGSCEYEEGGGRDWLFYDSCNDKVFKMRGEGILLLLSNEGSYLSRMYPSTNGLVLLMMKSDPDGQAIFFYKTN